MRAGTLNHRVTIQDQTTVQDGYGQEVVTWVDLATVWAAVEPVTGKEEYVSIGAQFLAEANVRIRIRYLPGLTAKMRVVFGTRIFNILYVAELLTTKKEIHFICKEFV